MKQIQKHPELYRLIKEYERHGNFLDWSLFKEELEKALTDDWIATDEMPPYLIGVLVYVENEDHITAGYLEPSWKNEIGGEQEPAFWTLTDEGRQIELQHVTHWRKLPVRPTKIEGGDD